MTFVHFLYLVVVAGVTYFLYRKRIVFAVIFAAFAAFFGTTIFTGVGFNARFGPDWIVPVILGLVSAFFASVGVGSFRWTLKHWRWFLVVGLVPCACVAILYIYMGAAQFQNRPVYIEPTITETEEPTLEPTEAAVATEIEATEIREDQVAEKTREAREQSAESEPDGCKTITWEGEVYIYRQPEEDQSYRVTRIVHNEKEETEVLTYNRDEVSWTWVSYEDPRTGQNFEGWMPLYQLSEDDC